MTFFPSICLICSTYSISGPNDSRVIRVQFPSGFVICLIRDRLRDRYIDNNILYAYIYIL